MKKRGQAPADRRLHQVLGLYSKPSALLAGASPHFFTQHSAPIAQHFLISDRVIHAGRDHRIPFVDLGVKGSGSEKSLHKVKLTLEIDTGGDPSKGRISDPSGPAPVKPKPGT